MIIRFDFKILFFLPAAVGTKSSDEALVKPLVLSQCVNIICPPKSSPDPSPHASRHRTRSIAYVRLSFQNRACDQLERQDCFSSVGHCRFSLHLLQP